MSILGATCHGRRLKALIACHPEGQAVAQGVHAPLLPRALASDCNPNSCKPKGSRIIQWSCDNGASSDSLSPSHLGASIALWAGPINGPALCICQATTCASVNQNVVANGGFAATNTPHSWFSGSVFLRGQPWQLMQVRVLPSALQCVAQCFFFWFLMDSGEWKFYRWGLQPSTPKFDILTPKWGWNTVTSLPSHHLVPHFVSKKEVSSNLLQAPPSLTTKCGEMRMSLVRGLNG